jgi:hypothetical protein
MMCFFSSAPFIKPLLIQWKSSLVSGWSLLRGKNSSIWLKSCLIRGVGFDGSVLRRVTLLYKDIEFRFIHMIPFYSGFDLHRIHCNSQSSQSIGSSSQSIWLNPFFRIFSLCFLTMQWWTIWQMTLYTNIMIISSNVTCFGHDVAEKLLIWH